MSGLDFVLVCFSAPLHVTHQNESRQCLPGDPELGDEAEVLEHCEDGGRGLVGGD